MLQKPPTTADSPDISEVVCSDCKASQCLFETSKCRNKDSTEKTITLRFEKKTKDQQTKKNLLNGIIIKIKVSHDGYLRR